MRICSLLPSATEIVFALGAGDSLVGVTHECDFPPEAERLPKVTRSNIPESLSSAEIDRAVSAGLESAGSLYELDLGLLESLAPELILTQRLCDVCAVSFDRVQEAVRGLASKPRVMNLEPHGLQDIFHTIVEVGEALECRARAESFVADLTKRVEAVRRRAAKAASRPRVLALEWVDPPYCGGHWMKELVELAGGRDELAILHRPSRRIEWKRVLDYSPEVIVFTCCGMKLERCLAEAAIFAKFPGAMDLPAARNGRVFATNGSSYFSRPGPRIVDSLEILAHIINPEIFAPPAFQAAFRPVALTRRPAIPAAPPVELTGSEC